MSFGPLSRTGTRVHPVTFHKCFGWLHRAPGRARSTLGVVLCSSIRREMSDAYRPLRSVADQMAQAGHDVLRFDYRGTGNAADLAGDPWSTWQADIEAAIDWMRATTGVEGVVLVGVRLGALLAALVAARRTDVAGLALLDPVLHGRSYVGRLRTEARLRRHDDAPVGADLAIDELVFSRQTLHSMSLINLDGIVLPAGCAVAIFSHANSGAVSACVDAMVGQGLDVTHQTLSGLEPILRTAADGTAPAPEAGRLVQWLHETAPPARWPVRPLRTAPPFIELAMDGWRETALQFGPGQRRFGVLCRPLREPEQDLVLIVGNIGGHPHHGPCRFAVELARRVAGAGLASLRMDFAGLGDSAGPEERPGGVIDDTATVMADLGAAIDLLEMVGYRRHAIYAVGRRAIQAFLASLADARVDALLTVDMPFAAAEVADQDREGWLGHGLVALASRSTRVLMLCAGDDDQEGEPGSAALDRCLGGARQALGLLHGAEIIAVPGLDPTMSTVGLRGRVADTVLGFLLARQTTPPSAAVPAPTHSAHGVAGQPETSGCLSCPNA